MPHHHHHPHQSSSSSATGSGSSGRSNSNSGLTSSFFPRSFAKLTQVGDTIPAYIPGFRTSAAFLSSLSANLQIQEESLLPSPISTPSSFRGASTTSFPRDISSSSSPALSGPAIEDFESASGLQINIPPPYNLLPSYSENSEMASADATASSQDPKPSTQEDEEQLPTLSTIVTTDPDDRIAALKLVADSIAQQRQFAARSLLGHPANASAFVLFAAVVAQFLYERQQNWALVFTTLAGITMSFLVAVRYATQGYIRHAEEAVTMEWLDDDTVIVTKFGKDVIGTVVLGWQAPAKGKKAKGGKGLLRAWTVRLKYRGKGEGRELLNEAVKVVKSKGRDGFEVEEGNIYEKRYLYKLYNAGFDRRDKRVKAAVERAVADQGGFSSSGKKR